MSWGEEVSWMQLGTALADEGDGGVGEARGCKFEVSAEEWVMDHMVAHMKEQWMKKQRVNNVMCIQTSDYLVTCDIKGCKYGGKVIDDVV